MNPIYFNYFFTPVGPEYKKTFARNVGIAVLILFSFYGVLNLVTDIQEPQTSSEKENTCDPGPIVEDGYCYKDGKKIVFESESKELECLRLYRDIRELSRTDGAALAERETIKQQREQLVQYIENDCPDFPDLELMYDNHVDSESESHLESKLISKSLAIFYAAEQRGWTEKNFTTDYSYAILLKIKNDGFAFEVDPDTLKEKQLYMNRFNEYDEEQYIWLVYLTENKEYEYHVDAATGKILLVVKDGTIIEK